MATETKDLVGPEGGDEGRELAKHWIDQIDQVKENTEYKRWIKRGEAIEKRYRDDRGREEKNRRYNALWSNVQILLPAFYGKTPVPVAERMFRDKDPIGRAAAQLLERALRNEIEINGFTEAMEQAVLDYLLPGRGTVWIRYVPEIQDSISLPPDPETDLPGEQGRDSEKTETTFTAGPDGKKRAQLNPPPAQPVDDKEAEEKLRETGDRVIRESVIIDFLNWKDFMTFPVRARTWQEVTAVAKRCFLSKDQAKRRFGREIGKELPMSKDKRGERSVTSMLPGVDDKVIIWEIWSREDGRVYWVAEGYQWLCDCMDDPLQLEHFFPCPRPIFANATTGTLVPVPDYVQYDDQAAQIDELSQRISQLTKACKMAGVYNAAAKDIQRLFDEGVENQMIPVADWAAFSGEKGGVEGNMSLLPVKDVIGIITELQTCKQQQIEEMDRLTGINDIMRGTSDARETLGGVRLKSNSTGTRLTHRQNEVARFARDTVRIMADIMCTHFSPQSLIAASGALYAAGLGPDDMPSLTALQNPAPPPPPAMPGLAAPPPGAPPMGMPKPMGMPPGAGPAPPGIGGPPPQPPGSNVIPFKPPGAPMAPGGPPGMPPGPPTPPMGVMPPPIPPEIAQKFEALQRIAKAILLLRDDSTRGFRVDIEVDSTIYSDMAQEKQERTEFIVATTQFLQQSMMLGAQMPEAIPLLGKMLQFGVRGYRVGRDLEAAIEEFAEEGAVKAKQRMEQPKPPDPKMLSAQADMIRATSDQEKSRATVQATNIQTASDERQAQMEAQASMQESQAEMARQQLENEGEQRNAAMDYQSNQLDLAMYQLDKDMKEIDKEIAESNAKMQKKKDAMQLQIEELKVKREKAKPMPKKTS